MKTMNFVWQKMLQCIFAMCLVFFVVACGEDDPIQPGNEKTTGDVSFVIDGNNETGSGTTSSPVVVTSGEALDMVISQKSSYTDPDGTVFTCEPEASIKLSATLDKVYAKDIKSLTTINESVDVKTSQSGSNPVVKSTVQTFAIGDQEVVFDLGYEIYNYVNSYSTKIEMPYIKINQAKFGNSSATEKGENTRSACPPIVLRSLSVTRASVTDSTIFEVTAKFSLDLETVNTEKKQTQSLNFDVTYLGVVEDVTELYGSVAYKLNDGTGEVNSPFSVEGGKELTINLAQTSTYANGDNAVYTAEPKAYIKLKVKNKVDSQENMDSLVTLVDGGKGTTSQSGDNPLVNLYKRTFATLGQAFDFETSYEVYKSESGDEMPYLKILEPKLVSIEATKQDNSTRATGYKDVYYDVVAKFEVEIEGVNVTEELKDVLTFEVKYIGGSKEAVELLGELDYTISDGTNDVKSPFVVAGGSELNLSIKQKSTYTNGDNVEFTAEPKATLKLKVKNEVDSQEKLDSLVTLVGDSKAVTSQSGENPIVNLYKKSFTTLGQAFDFEASYEVYKSENGDEMPYLKILEPKLVKIEAIKQENATRAVGYEDVRYDIVAKFEVEIEGVNVAEDLKDVLSFEVKYVGVSKEAVELSGDVDFTVGDGTSDLTSPFKVAGGNELNLEIKQTSTYANGNEVMYTAEPKAIIKLKAKNASNFVEELEALSTLIETENPTLSQSGENPLVNLYKGSFATLGQSFDFETSYEVYKTENGDEMPYLKVSEPKLVNIEVKERATTRVIVKDTTYYDVTAKFEVELLGVNTNEELNKTLSFDVNYTGGVVTSSDVPVELLKTEYRKDMIVYDGHDNLTMRAQAVVYRDRYYSDGSIQVDTLKESVAMDLYDHNIANNPRGTKIDDTGDGVSGTYQIAEGLTMRYTRHETSVQDYTALIYRYVSSIEVPDLSYLSGSAVNGLDWTDDVNAIGHPSEDLSEFIFFDTGEYYDKANPQNGIYVYPVDNSVSNLVRYKYNSKYYELIRPRFAIIWYDRIASVDGELITFEEFRPTIKDVKNFKTYEEVEATSTRGPARVYTAEAMGTYLGKEMHLISIDTVYVAK